MHHNNIFQPQCNDEYDGVMIGEPDGWERFFIWLERAHQTVNDFQAQHNQQQHHDDHDTKSSHENNNGNDNGVRVYIAAWWSDASTTFRPTLT